MKKDNLSLLPFCCE